MALLPYCVLCVRTGAGIKHQPTWTLTEYGQPSTSFEFLTADGIDIVGAAAPGKVHFETPSHVGADKSKFTWRPGKSRNARLQHWSKIRPVGGGDNVCKAYDPIIINTDQ